MTKLIASILIVCSCAIVLADMVLPHHEALAQVASVASAPAPAPTGDDVEGERHDSLRVVGGSPEQHILIAEAAGRFAAVGLHLEAVTVVVHPSREGCQGAAGLYWPSSAGDRIDLCGEGERLVLHELAHAWAHHALDDHDRHDFVSRTGLPTWKSLEHPHGRRATEVAADAIAFGLLSRPLDADDARRALTDLEHFVTLTGFEPPRLQQPLTEIAAMPVPTVDPVQVSIYASRTGG